MRMPCTFCATGKIKYLGPLTAEEIALQNIFMAFYDSSCPSWPQVRAHSREFAYMGQGEPGLMYPQIRRSILLTDEAMLRTGQNVHRYIISTVGVTDMLDLLIEDFKNHIYKHPVTLHFSLHAISPERGLLMPIDNIYPYKQTLLKAKEIYEITGEKMAVGVLLFSSFSTNNTDLDFTISKNYLNKILNSLDNRYHRIDLCDVNNNRSIKHQSQVSNEYAHRLLYFVKNNGFAAKLFSSFGSEENSGCGMLISSRAKTQKVGDTTIDRFESSINLLSEIISKKLV